MSLVWATPAEAGRGVWARSGKLPRTRILVSRRGLMWPQVYHISRYEVAEFDLLLQQESKYRRYNAAQREDDARIPVSPFAGEQRNRGDHQANLQQSFAQVKAVSLCFGQFHLSLQRLGLFELVSHFLCPVGLA